MLPARQSRYSPQAARANSARLLSALIGFQRPILETTSASSARFPCLHVRSRNQSPPGSEQPCKSSSLGSVRPRRSSRTGRALPAALLAGLVAEAGRLAGGERAAGEDERCCRDCVPCAFQVPPSRRPVRPLWRHGHRPGAALVARVDDLNHRHVALVPAGADAHGRAEGGRGAGRRTADGGGEGEGEGDDERWCDAGRGRRGREGDAGRRGRRGRRRRRRAARSRPEWRRRGQHDGRPAGSSRDGPTARTATQTTSATRTVTAAHRKMRRAGLSGGGVLGGGQDRPFGDPARRADLTGPPGNLPDQPMPLARRPTARLISFWASRVARSCRLS